MQVSASGFDGNDGWSDLRLSRAGSSLPSSLFPSSLFSLSLHLPSSSLHSLQQPWRISPGLNGSILSDSSNVRKQTGLRTKNESNTSYRGTQPGSRPTRKSPPPSYRRSRSRASSGVSSSRSCRARRPSNTCEGRLPFARRRGRAESIRLSLQGLLGVSDGGKECPARGCVFFTSSSLPSPADHVTSYSRHLLRRRRPHFRHRHLRYQYRRFPR